MYEASFCHLRKWIEDAHAEQEMRCIPKPISRPTSAPAKVMSASQRRNTQVEQLRLNEMRTQEASRRREEAYRMTQEELQRKWKQKQVKQRHNLQKETRARQEEMFTRSEMRRSQSATVLRRKFEVEKAKSEQTDLKAGMTEVCMVLARQLRADSVRRHAEAARKENERQRENTEDIRRLRKMQEEAQRDTAEGLQKNYVPHSDIRAETLRERAEECRRKRELREAVSHGIRRNAMSIKEARTKANLQQLQHCQSPEPHSTGTSKHPPYGLDSCSSSTKTRLRGPLPTEQLVEQIKALVGSSWNQNVTRG